MLLKSEERKLQRVFLKVWPETIIHSDDDLMREQKRVQQEKKIQKNKKKKKFLSFVPSSLYFKNASGSTAPYKNHKRFAQEESDDDF